MVWKSSSSPMRTRGMRRRVFSSRRAQVNRRALPSRPVRCYGRAHAGEVHRPHARALRLPGGPQPAARSGAARPRGRDRRPRPDQPGSRAYYAELLPRLRSGGVIGFDNVLWGGSVADPSDTSDDTVALRALNDFLVRDERVDLVMLPVADGLTLVRKR